MIKLTKLNQHLEKQLPNELRKFRDFYFKMKKEEKKEE